MYQQNEMKHSTDITLISPDRTTPALRIMFHELPVMIGRGGTVAIQIDDQWVSRHHCEINAIQGTLIIRDLGSKTGTWVNGLRVTESHVFPGDRVTVGRTSFTVDYKRRRHEHAVPKPEVRASETPCAGLRNSTNTGMDRG